MHLRGDLDFATSKERKDDPEYIHEAFQRLILKFLVANNTEKFMGRWEGRQSALCDEGRDEQDC